MKTFLLAGAALAASVAAPASAATFLGQTTLSSPTFDRTLSGTPPTALSTAGRGVHYQLVAFTVGTTGSYSFLMTGLTPTNWDTFLSLYSGSFNPSAPLTNVLAANDDFGSIGRSGFTQTLTAGTSYFAIATGFSANNVGAYSLTIDGPGVVNLPGAAAVPEPATWAMMLLGFGGLGFAMRRRNVRMTVRYA